MSYSIGTNVTNNQVKLTDGTDQLAINADGSINAAITGSVTTSGTSSNICAVLEATSVTNGTTGSVVYTPTATKTFYMTALVLTESAAAGLIVRLSDGIYSAANLRFEATMASAGTALKTITLTFSSPIKFATSVNLTHNSGGAQIIEQCTVVGFEI